MRKITAILLTVILAVSATSCSDSGTESSLPDTESSSETEETTAESETTATEPATEISTTEPPAETTTAHVSPTETISVNIGVQQTINKSISMKENSNTIKFPLCDFIQEGDVISSFVFIIKADTDIGKFEGGCGISVNGDCPSATNEGWYQSENFTASTDGAYGEITWTVPSNIRDYIYESGDVLFGYWSGNAGSITITEVVCNLTRTAEFPCDDTVSQQTDCTVGYNDTENRIHIPADFLPADAVPQVITYNISSTGALGKFTGGFGYDCSGGYFSSEDIVMFTDNSDISIKWILPDDAKYTAEDAEFIFGYWWSRQPTVKLESISVSYSIGGAVEQPSGPSAPVHSGNTNFRDSSEIVSDIKVGWNLGNSLESYDTGKKGLATETGWGNPKSTEDTILAVKNAGFNAIRIPVTWGEHMDGDIIQSEWLDRVQEVVNYAYNNDMYVIINMHHDDYIWFNPTEDEYNGDSAKLKKIWEQISERFIEYDDRLLFEGVNEPRTIGSDNEWVGGTEKERAVVNKYIQDFVDTVRASGGNNIDRTLIVTSYGASAEEVAMNDIVVPADEHIIVSLHYYAPWEFSDGQSTEFGTYEEAELEAKFSAIKKKFIDNGIPAIIDEFGCVAVADDDTRAGYYEYYISSAKKYGIKCFVWDNGLSSGESSFGLLDRNNLTWNETILDSIISGAE